MTGVSKLIKGYNNFQQNHLEGKKELLSELAKGQSPEVLLITCSDSRIDYSLLLDTDPGDLFVIRNAGNVIPSNHSETGEIGTIQFAIDVLGIKEVVVCGHSECGAIKGALAIDTTKEYDHLYKWLCCIEDDKKVSNECSLEGNIKASAIHQCDKLADLDFVKGKDISITPWYLNLSDYSIESYNKEDKSWQKL